MIPLQVPRDSKITGPIGSDIYGSPLPSQRICGQKKSKKNKLPLACRNGVWDKNHPKCQVKVDKVMSPMDID